MLVAIAYGYLVSPFVGMLVTRLRRRAAGGAGAAVRMTGHGR